MRAFRYRLFDLALELTAGEYAYYTVHEVEKPCQVSIEGVALEDTEIELFCNGEPVGKVALSKTAVSITDTENLAISEPVIIPAGEEAVVRLAVKQGTVQIKNVNFAY